MKPALWKRVIKDPELLLTALTHSSYSNENGGMHYQRLEFLGDSVLDLLSATYLMRAHKNEREGFLSMARAELVCTKRLAQLAKERGISEFIMLGKAASSISNNIKLLADVMEALVGAAYTDGGMQSAAIMAHHLGIVPL